MSRQRFFVLVEGRDHDRPFYERLLKKHPEVSAAGFSVRIVEDLELDGISAGGKPFAHKLFDYFENAGFLEQHNSEGPRQIVFMLDKDFEDFEPSRRASSHLITTESADVEAEILHAGRIRTSVAATYGLSRHMSKKVLPTGSDPFNDLGQAWRRWLHARAVSSACSLPGGTRFGNVSQINVDEFGLLDSSLEAILFDQLDDRLTDMGSPPEASTAVLEIDNRLAANRGNELLKGRWVAKYLAYMVATSLTDEVVKKASSPNTVIAVCLQTVDFKGQWTGYYHDRLNTLLLVA